MPTTMHVTSYAGAVTVLNNPAGAAGALSALLDMIPVPLDMTPAPHREAGA